MPATILLAAALNAAVPTAADSTPPQIRDFAVAANNFYAAPIITAVLSDDSTGIDSAVVYVRTNDDKEQFQPIPLQAGDGGLFLAALPDGMQRTGFQYYFEVRDAAGNGPVAIGSADEPLRIAPAPVPVAKDGTIPANYSEQRDVYDGKVHPAWVASAMGLGLLAGVGSGLFFGDAVFKQNDITLLDTQLAAANDATTRAALTEQRQEKANLQLQSIIFGSTLSAVALVSLGTGVAMMALDAE